MDIEKFKKEYNLCKYRINIINDYYNKHGDYKNKKDYYNECYIFYESIDNLLNIQNKYLLELYYIVYNKQHSKKTIRKQVINHRNKLLNIKEGINNTSFLLSYKLEYNKKLIDMYENTNTFEYNKIVNLISECLNYIKLLNILIDFFNLNNETFYSDIKILEKKMNNNDLLIISV
jgi:hypothetical protein